SDLRVRYAAKQMPAEQCSTGEQKALLIGLVLAHARLVLAEQGAPPILLLDEVAAHLDEGRRAALYNLLQQTGGQVWLTGTDREFFKAIEGAAPFFEIRNGRVV
ncbi:MAG TPA: DNA replication and repair protein RecF, partial [Alphaproteobacteria bacterium]|nr:DNA replication and repair protein RecF [Alphaproteobacteria bacterium]